MGSLGHEHGEGRMQNLPFKVRQHDIHLLQSLIIILVQLKNAKLFRQESFVHGEWIESISGGWFDVAGWFGIVPGMCQKLTSCRSWNGRDLGYLR